MGRFIAISFVWLGWQLHESRDGSHEAAARYETGLLLRRLLLLMPCRHSEPVAALAPISHALSDASC